MAEDIHIQTDEVGITSRQRSGQFLCADAVKRGLVVAQVVVGQLDAERPEDAIAVQLDQLAARQGNDEG